MQCKLTLELVVKTGEHGVNYRDTMLEVLGKRMSAEKDVGYVYGQATSYNTWEDLEATYDEVIAIIDENGFQASDVYWRVAAVTSSDVETIADSSSKYAMMFISDKVINKIAHSPCIFSLQPSMVKRKYMDDNTHKYLTFTRSGSFILMNIVNYDEGLREVNVRLSVFNISFALSTRRFVIKVFDIQRTIGFGEDDVLSPREFDISGTDFSGIVREMWTTGDWKRDFGYNKRYEQIAGSVTRAIASQVRAYALERAEGHAATDAADKDNCIRVVTDSEKLISQKRLVFNQPAMIHVEINGKDYESSLMFEQSEDALVSPKSYYMNRAQRFEKRIEDIIQEVEDSIQDKPKPAPEPFEPQPPKRVILRKRPKKEVSTSLILLDYNTEKIGIKVPKSVLENPERLVAALFTTKTIDDKTWNDIVEEYGKFGLDNPLLDAIAMDTPAGKDLPIKLHGSFNITAESEEELDEKIDVAILEGIKKADEKRAVSA